MHEYVRMNIFLPSPFLQRGFILVFPCYLVKKTDEVEHQWCLSYHGELLGVLNSNFAIFRFMQRSSTHEHRGAVSAFKFLL